MKTKKFHGALVEAATMLPDASRVLSSRARLAAKRIGSRYHRRRLRLKSFGTITGMAIPGNRTLTLKNDEAGVHD